MTQEAPHIDIEFLEQQVRLKQLQLQMYFDLVNQMHIATEAHLYAKKHMEKFHGDWVQIIENNASGSIKNHPEYQKRLYIYYSDQIIRRIAMQEIKEVMEGLPNG